MELQRGQRLATPYENTELQAASAAKDVGYAPNRVWLQDHLAVSLRPARRSPKSGGPSLAVPSSLISPASQRPITANQWDSVGVAVSGA